MSIEVLQWIVGGSGVAFITFIVKSAMDYQKTKTRQDNTDSDVGDLKKEIAEKDILITELKKSMEGYQKLNDEKYDNLFSLYILPMSNSVAALTENIKNLREENAHNNKNINEKLNQLLMLKETK